MWLYLGRSNEIFPGELAACLLHAGLDELWIESAGDKSVCEGITSYGDGCVILLIGSGTFDV